MLVLYYIIDNPFWDTVAFIAKGWTDDCPNVAGRDRTSQKVFSYLVPDVIFKLIFRKL